MGIIIKFNFKVIIKDILKDIFRYRLFLLILVTIFHILFSHKT